MPNAELTGRGDNEAVIRVLRMKSPLSALRSNDVLGLPVVSAHRATLNEIPFATTQDGGLIRTNGQAATLFHNLPAIQLLLVQVPFLNSEANPTFELTRRRAGSQR